MNQNERPSQIVVQLTSPGRGAVATVRVEGPDCVATADRFFIAHNKKTLADTPTDRPAVGHFHSPSSPAAEEVVARRCSPRAVEIHCHGGTASVSRIVATFEAEGYTPITWSEWIERETPNLIRAEAYRDMAGAKTELTATLLLYQYQGALDREMEQIRQIDDPIERHERLRTLYDRSAWGAHLVRPWQIVLAGSPNVGKSSLMNRLLGYERTITDPTPGTTRDLIRGPSVLAGWPVELIDTAGLRDGDHPVEQQGVERALGQLQVADLVLLLLDATRPPTDDEVALLNSLAEQHSVRFLVVRSKSDLAPTRDPWGPFADTPAATRAIDTSATTGDGLDDLTAAIQSFLLPPTPPAATPIPWTAAQIQAICAALKNLNPEP
ncbi:MAG: GTP-binding protein [Planctomycetia bacterium]